MQAFGKSPLKRAWKVRISSIYFRDGLFLGKNLFSILNFDFNHYDTYLKLPPNHFDPFDRMLIAQAQSENLTIITQDDKFGKYFVPIIWN